MGSRLTSLLLLIFLPLMGAACTNGAVKPPKPPPTVGTPPPEPADPFAVTGQLAEEQLPDVAQLTLPLRQHTFGPAPQGVPAPPAHCSAFVRRRAKPEVSCPDAASARAELARAVAVTEPAARDAHLVGVEGCTSLPAGLIRALRAELAPVECADAVVAPLLASPPAGIDGGVYDTLFGLGLAGRFARTVLSPPKMEPPYDKERIKEFNSGPLGAWIMEQAKAIETMAKMGAQLSYYGKAIAAVEAGMADMRFVDAIRKAPLPEEFKKDDELRNTYYGNLEIGLDPRKQRGRDATLVGLGQLAFVGVIRDPRVDRARALLSRLYGGSPINALDKLLLPPLSPANPATDDQRLAARLPTFYTSVLVPAEQAGDETMFRMLMEKGVPLPHRVALAKAELTPAVRLLYARARLELAQNYWRSVDIDQVAALLLGLDEQQRGQQGRYLLALAIALRGGPKNAAEMMVKAPLAKLGIGHVAALDALTAEEPAGPYRGMAAFNAAWLSYLSAPPDSPAARFRELAGRFRKAASLLTDIHERAEAEKLAKDADDTAAAVAAGQ